ncbi:MAG TPA: zf-HC2 domain-containing protein [Candidatus Acidoferrales bacterium]|nr:zf-HC2 domain-containing protein [Candidatus Acidoferrales bacterium]
MTSQHPTTDRIIDYVHHELTPSEDAVLFEHFSACAACREEYETELRLTNALRSAAVSETLELPSNLKAEIWNRVRSSRPTFWSLVFRPLVAVPVAAAIAVAAFFAFQPSVQTASGHPMVGAQYYFASHSAATRQESPLTDRSAPVLNVIDASDVSSNSASPLVEAAGVASGDDFGR